MTAGVGSGPAPAELRVDLHMHSTASDGRLTPEAVVARAREAGLSAIALTDHDTVAGVPAALSAATAFGVRVVSGCEFSVGAPWGEMHVLGYFLPVGSDALEAFLAGCRADRIRRGQGMVALARQLGVSLEFDRVLAHAAGGAVGRPHVARALVEVGAATDVQDAFNRYLGRGRPAYVEKVLPSFADVARLVHSVGGIVSAAHLKDRGTRRALIKLKAEGLDAVETRHPSHDPDTRARLADLAAELRLATSGGSDWHGDEEGSHGALGSQEVPLAWLDRLETLRPSPHLS